jgi:CRISPR system Cascade subunit CasD
MGVRIDRAGQLRKEYQTAGGGDWNGGFYDLRKYGVYRASGAIGDTVLSNRYYLVDAVFHVALEHDDPDFLNEIKSALHNPKWAIYLGRKSYVPSHPLCLGIYDGDVESVLKQLPYQLHKSDKEPSKPLQIVVECEHGEGAARMDVPLSFVKDNRQFGLRFVKHEHIKDFPIEPRKENSDVSISTHTESVA